ncbi:MAG: hypothetical protein MZU95_08915 [Desulfomicrobium escambiense]|nr:hypothetical protein [Desulfomicrobium escambiense]
MSVFVSIEDGEGEHLEPVFEVSQIVRRFRHPKGYACLAFIDETEDAFFNQKQLPILLRELAELASLDLKPAEREELERIAAACSRAAGRSRVYARFYGEG